MSVVEEQLLQASGLRVSAGVGGERRTLVSGVDLEVRRGETVGIVGESGSGKTMTARAIAGLLAHGVTVEGSATVRGTQVVGASERRLRRLRGREVALLMQDPFSMLNPLLRVGVQITDAMREERALSGAERRAEAVRRLAEVGIADPGVADRYPFQLSGGMRQRVGLAAALACDPELLIADEPSTALDVTTQHEVLQLLKRVQAMRGMGVILITHDLRVAFSMCDRIHVLYAGRALEQGSGAALEAEPLHPYTLGLLLSEPSVSHRARRLVAIAGSVPRADDVAGCCAFAARCRWAAGVCREAAPPLAEAGPGRRSACVRLGEIRGEMAQLRAQTQATEHVPCADLGGAPLLHVEGLRKTFGGARRGADATVALRDVSILVNEGESVGIVGESGSGKTTLARCLVGLEHPDGGRIELDGLDASRQRAMDAAARRELRRRVQLVFQDPYASLNPVRTVGATLSEVLQLGGVARRERERAVGELLERVGLAPDCTRRKPVALSGGERQRVAIARALALRPKLIVCDEPVSALDVSVQAQILNLLVSLREELGVAYLFITHDLAVVRQVADRIYVLYCGEVVEHGPADRVLDEPVHVYTKRLVASAPGSTLVRGEAVAASPEGHRT